MAADIGCQNRVIIRLLARWAPMANSSPPSRIAAQVQIAPDRARAMKATGSGSRCRAENSTPLIRHSSERMAADLAGQPQQDAATDDLLGRRGDQQSDDLAST